MICTANHAFICLHGVCLCVIIRQKRCRVTGLNVSTNQTGDEKRRHMINDPVDKLVMKLAVPTIISSLVTTFYNMADTFFVRQLDNDSMVAAVGVAMPLMTIIQAVGFYHGHGSGNYISRAFGRQDYKSAERMASTGFFYAVFFGLLISVLGLSFQAPFARFLGAKTDATVLNTVHYMRYILLAAPFMTGALVMNNQLRLQGNAFFSMIGLTSGAVLNLILDPLLIFRPGQTIFSGSVTVPFGAGMGVAGAALATGLSQTLSFAILLAGVYLSDNVKIRLKNFSFKPYYIRNIVKGGLPSLARQGTMSIATMCLNHSIGLYMSTGLMIDAAQAAMTGVSRVMNFLFSAVIGFGQGFQPVCGFNFGAGRYDRVIEAFHFCLKRAVAVLLAIAALGFIFARPITNLVAGASPEAAAIALFTFRAQLITLPFTAWVTLCNMAMQNIGYTARATLLALARQGLTFAPTILLLPMLMRMAGLDPLLGLELSQTVADILALLISLPIGIGMLRQLRSLQLRQTELSS